MNRAWGARSQLPVLTFGVQRVHLALGSSRAILTPLPRFLFPRRASSIPFAKAFLGSVNTIKAQQKTFQAAKKASGNTFLTGSASSMMSNYFVTAWCFLGCGFACTVGLKNMYYGINKYVVADDD